VASFTFPSFLPSRRLTTLRSDIPIVFNQITKWQKYSQNTTIFISYERVDHITVYNYMFRPLSSGCTTSYYYILSYNYCSLGKVEYSGTDITCISDGVLSEAGIVQKWSK
jgi:hypothetical protein